MDRRNLIVTLGRGRCSVRNVRFRPRSMLAPSNGTVVTGFLGTWPRPCVVGVGTVLSHLFGRRRLGQGRTGGLLLGVAQKVCGSTRVTTLLAIFRVHNVGMRRLVNFHRTLLAAHVPVSFSTCDPVSVINANNSKGGAFGVSAYTYFVMTKTKCRITGRNGCNTASIDKTDGIVRRRNMGFAGGPSGLAHSVRRYKVICVRTRLFGPTVGDMNPIHGTLRMHAVFGLLNPLIGPYLPTCRLLKITSLPRVHLCAGIFRGLNVNFTMMGGLSNCSRVSLASRFGIVAGHCRAVCGPSRLNFSLTERRRLCNKGAPRRTSGVFGGMLRGGTAGTRASYMLVGTSFTVRTVRPTGPVRRYITVTHRSLRDKGTLGALGGFIRLGD